MSMLDWNAYRQQLTVKVGEIARLSPDTVKGYVTLGAGQKTGRFDAKTGNLSRSPWQSACDAARRDGRPRAQAEGDASGVVGMTRARPNSGQAAKRPVAATPGASLPLDASILLIVANLRASI